MLYKNPFHYPISFMLL